MIDPKAYGRPRSFSGADEEWDGWAFVARSHLSLLTEDAEHWLEVAEAAPGGSASVLLAALTAEARDFARVLYHVLVSTVQGKALAVIRGGERANGLQCWVLLCDEYEPKSGSRLTTLLCGLLAPPWQGLEGPAFLRALAAWEVEARRYESQSQEAIGEGIKVATLMRHAPESDRHLLRHSASSVGTSFARARQVVQDYVKSGVDYTVNLRPDDTHGRQCDGFRRRQAVRGLLQLLRGVGQPQGSLPEARCLPDIVGLRRRWWCTRFAPSQGEGNQGQTRKGQRQ